MNLTADLGDSKTFTIPMRWGNRAFEPGEVNWGLTFTVKADADTADSAALLQASGPGTGLNLEVSGSNAIIQLQRADTYRPAVVSPASPEFQAAPGTYYWDIQATGIPGEAYEDECRTVARGTLVLSRDITRASGPTIDVFTTTEPVFQGPPGPAGDSAYDSYVATTADDPVLSEAAWIESLGGGGASTADAVSYDPTASGLTATDVQSAIDEVAESGGGGSIPMSASFTAEIGKTYHVTGPLTITDPAGVEGEGYEALIIAGGVEIGDVTYNTVYNVAGTIIKRHYVSGVWKSWVHVGSENPTMLFGTLPAFEAFQGSAIPDNWKASDINWTGAVVGSGVTTIGDGAFYNCSGLDTLNCYVTRTIINQWGVLTGCLTPFTLHAQASDGTWTAGADTVGDLAVTVVKDL